MPILSPVLCGRRIGLVLSSEFKRRVAMTWSETRKRWLVTVPLLLLPSVVIGCVVVKDSPAPGCIERWGIPMAGGCFGKSAVLDLKVTPPVDCLTVEVNNCNGGILEVQNNCDEPLALGGVTIEPSAFAGLDVSGEGGGGHTLTETASNFSAYVPQENEAVELVGALGELEVQVSFTKTKKLCD